MAKEREGTLIEERRKKSDSKSNYQTTVSKSITPYIAILFSV